MTADLVENPNERLNREIRRRTESVGIFPSQDDTIQLWKVPVNVPQDRAGSFEPQIAHKHQRRWTGFDETVISLYAKRHDEL